MGKIPIRSGFQLIPEGLHVFRIYDAEYDEEFGKLIVKLINAKGQTHIERFSLQLNSGEWNEKALNAFSYFAKVALQNNDVESVDPSELINHYIKAEIKHTKFESSKEPGKTITYANLGDKFEANEFDTPACDRALTLGVKQSVDLNDLLGD